MNRADVLNNIVSIFSLNCNWLQSKWLHRHSLMMRCCPWPRGWRWNERSPAKTIKLMNDKKIKMTSEEMHETWSNATALDGGSLTRDFGAFLKCNLCFSKYIYQFKSLDKVNRIISQVNSHYITDFYFILTQHFHLKYCVKLSLLCCCFFLKNHSRGRAFVPKLMHSRSAWDQTSVMNWWQSSSQHALLHRPADWRELHQLLSQCFIKRCEAQSSRRAGKKRNNQSRPEQRGPQDPLTKRVSLPALRELLLEEWWLSWRCEGRSQGSKINGLISNEECDDINKKDDLNRTGDEWRLSELLTGWMVGEYGVSLMGLAVLV